MTTTLTDLQKRIHDYEKTYHRTAHSVRLLAVSKAQSIEKIASLYQQGQRAFGENYLQEALLKIPALPTDIEWHFIGTLQRNKTRRVAENFAWVQSVTSIELAKRLNEQRPSHLLPLNICIEINLQQEHSKSGVYLNDVETLMNYCATRSNLKLRGIMAIPQPQSSFTAQCAVFHELHTLYQSLQMQGFALDTLSMGMSDDFEAAIAEGTTLIRIGRALFGERV